MTIYLDNSATTKADQRVLDAMHPYFSLVYANPSSMHSEGQKASAAVEKARQIIAKKMHASSYEIRFTSGGTESNNLALKGVAYANRQNGNHLITSAVEHPSILETCKHLERDGFKVAYIPVDRFGAVDTEKVKQAITPSTILVSIIHANNEIGTINNIQKIGLLCRKRNVLFHTDAVQSFTKVPLNVRKIFADLVSFSSHKVHGSKGIGALYVKAGTAIERMMDGGKHEFGIRAGTLNVPAIVGFGKAVEISRSIEIKKMARLRDFFIKEVLKIKGTFLNGHPSKRLCNNINICFQGISGEEILHHLDKDGIFVSLGAACKAGEKTASHVLTGIGLSTADASSSIRFSLSKFTSKNDILFTLKKLKEIVSSLRKI